MLQREKEITRMERADGYQGKTNQNPGTHDKAKEQSSLDQGE
jgi:hypothetical protein